ncbi:MAG: OmpA family protein [bacterium]|nr:OmpA family protein [bacterium]
MNHLTFRRVFGLLTLATLIAVPGLTAELTLHETTFPESRNTDVDFSRTTKAPNATLTADVKHREGHAEISVRFKNMKPAVLFGGDITSYVLWAISSDGDWENLGELWVRKANDKVELTSALKAFALIVTAEAYPLVSQPSELVLFTSMPGDDKRAISKPFTFSDLAPAPTTGMISIANVQWDSSEPMDLLQAEKAVELAQRVGAADYTPQLLREATLALAQAQALAKTPSPKKEIIDHSRRAVSRSSDAIQTTLRTKEREEIERQIAERKAEMESLEQRARDAESMASTAKLHLAEATTQKATADAAILAATAELTRVRAEKTAMEAEREALLAEKTSLETQQQNLQVSIAEMSERAEKLHKEREQLASRLQSALSHVADTQNSARGMIVNLPDILFDTNEATLKQEARVVIAKLSGILLIISELNLRIEGHTDATGSDTHNQSLSERRASSVKDFLAGQGININRIVAVGYGENRPVAENETREGRSKNRRVEIVMNTGEVAEDSNY